MPIRSYNYSYIRDRLLNDYSQKVALSDADAEKDYNRKYDLLYANVAKDKKVNFFDKMLAFDSKKVFILPDDSTTHDQNQ